MKYCIRQDQQSRVKSKLKHSDKEVTIRTKLEPRNVRDSNPEFAR